MSGHRIPNDANRVNVNDAAELDYWIRELDCTPDALREAVSAVGVELDDVRLHLSQSAS